MEITYTSHGTIARIRTAAYIRVSTQEQKLHGLSLDAQRQKLQAYADDHDMEIVAWYADEGVSGRKLISKRPQLQKMISDAEAGRFTHIIFIKLDRFFRSVAEYHTCMKRLGKVTWSATEERYDLTTANGRFFVNAKLAVAEMEADQTAERIKLVNEYKAKSGIPTVPTRSLPFYFANVNRTIVRRNEEACMALVDHVERTCSIRSGMTMLQEKYGMNISYRSVADAIRNPLLMGQYRDNPNFCEGYISRERFMALQEKLARNNRAPTKHTYIFQGLVKCPECGKGLNGTMHNATVAGKRYSYKAYRCPLHKISKTCGFAGMVFEAFLEKEVFRYLSTGGSSAGDTHTEAPQPIDTAPISAELDRLNYAWVKGRISPEDYDTRYDEITTRLQQAEAHNASLKSSPSPNLALRFPPEFLETYKQMDDTAKQHLWKTSIRTMYIHWQPNKKEEKYISSIEWLDF